MLNQLYQSYMHFAWLLYTAFWVILTVYSFPLAWFIAFGKGTYTIRIGNFVILELESIENNDKGGKNGPADRR
ncbi:MAG TPA: hypothetical protein PKK51_10170 [Rhodocyclaceae bacterium]|nr:hypothetical protein [Rhodocyclaceae bacterium]